MMCRPFLFTMKKILKKKSCAVFLSEVIHNARVAARYQQVHEVVIVEDLPRSTAGKTLKRVLREQYAVLTSTRA